ncbi:hypothetical protein [Sulfitobacter sp. R18_1]|uniref:hypothetical protein n=1 Tax=Sulfitobacter sp. R18_1 TaxID=2821104 RepID=UPI001AD9E7E8|nr:hypothetical protein [Sulfitobacter sp. R18_1]MBO9428047.1 hypothetical protein [Sulfitobacter sp. R18_1]
MDLDTEVDIVLDLMDAMGEYEFALYAAKFTEIDLQAVKGVYDNILADDSNAKMSESDRARLVTSLNSARKTLFLVKDINAEILLYKGIYDYILDIIGEPQTTTVSRKDAITGKLLSAAENYAEFTKLASELEIEMQETLRTMDVAGRPIF